MATSSPEKQPASCIGHAEEGETVAIEGEGLTQTRVEKVLLMSALSVR